MHPGSRSSSSDDDMTSFRKLESPSSERNKGPIWEVLAGRVLPPIVDKGTSPSVQANCTPPKAQNHEDRRGSSDDDDADDGNVGSINGPTVIRVLEIAAGAGVHMQYFALNILMMLEERRQHNIATSKRELDVILKWYPTDPCRASLASQLAYRHDCNDLLASVVPEPLPLTLNERGIVEPDTAQQLESVSNGAGGRFDVILCINMVHISPWSATLGLFQVASQFLRQDDDNVGAALVLYGPFRVQGAMVESNARFDDYLKGQDPSFGVRNLEDVVQVANQAGLDLAETIEMPANNLCLVFRRRQRGDD